MKNILDESTEKKLQVPINEYSNDNFHIDVPFNFTNLDGENIIIKI